MAVIQSGASADLLTIDPISKAARGTLYDAAGNLLITIDAAGAAKSLRLRCEMHYFRRSRLSPVRRMRYNPPMNSLK
jgi:hypothetical protein